LFWLATQQVKIPALSKTKTEFVIALYYFLFAEKTIDLEFAIIVIEWLIEK
jgi:hypothetical protein